MASRDERLSQAGACPVHSRCVTQDECVRVTLVALARIHVLLPASVSTLALLCALSVAPARTTAAARATHPRSPEPAGSPPGDASTRHGRHASRGAALHVLRRAYEVERSLQDAEEVVDLEGTILRKVGAVDSVLNLVGAVEGAQ